MAGIKNMYQQYGGNPFQPVKGDTIWDRNLAFQTQEYTPYCQFCGEELINAHEDENGHKVDPEWERLNQTHYRCYLKNRR